MNRKDATIWEKQGLKGRFANQVRIGVSESEIVLDFGQYFLEEDQWFHTRIIMTPKDVGNLLETLKEALGQDEERAGGHGQEQ